MNEPNHPPSWPLVSSETDREYQMFGVRRDRARSPKDDQVREFDVVESPGGVTVLAFTPDREMVLVEQYRHGTRELSLETPSGVVDEGEDPVEAGLRELREETGYEAEGAEHLGTIDLNPSWQSTRVHVVLARGAVARAEKELDSSEDTRVRLAPLARVREWVAGGEIRSAVVLAALTLLDQNGRNGA